MIMNHFSGFPGGLSKGSSSWIGSGGAGSRRSVAEVGTSTSSLPVGLWLRHTLAFPVEDEFAYSSSSFEVWPASNADIVKEKRTLDHVDVIEDGKVGSVLRDLP